MPEGPSAATTFGSRMVEISSRASAHWPIWLRIRAGSRLVNRSVFMGSSECGEEVSRPCQVVSGQKGVDQRKGLLKHARGFVGRNLRQAVGHQPGLLIEQAADGLFVDG